MEETERQSINLLQHRRAFMVAALSVAVLMNSVAVTATHLAGVLLLIALGACALAVIRVVMDAIAFIANVKATRLRRPGWEWSCLIGGLLGCWLALGLVLGHLQAGSWKSPLPESVRQFLPFG